MGDDVPGYFMGAPQQAPAAGAAGQEQKHENTNTPGDYFMGTPENIRHQQQQAQPKPSASRSKWACCFGGSEVQN